MSVCENGIIPTGTNTRDLLLLEENWASHRRPPGMLEAATATAMDTNKTGACVARV